MISLSIVASVEINNSHYFGTNHLTSLVKWYFFIFGINTESMEPILHKIQKIVFSNLKLAFCCGHCGRSKEIRPLRFSYSQQAKI